MYRCVIYEEFGVISLAVENRARNICNLLLKLPVVICMCRNGRFTVPGEPIKSIGDAEEDFWFTWSNFETVAVAPCTVTTCASNQPPTCFYSFSFNFFSLPLPQAPQAPQAPPRQQQPPPPCPFYTPTHRSLAAMFRPPPTYNSVPIQKCI
jgi:hypothetical protein